MRTAGAALAAALALCGPARALSLPMTCQTWTGLNRVLVRVQSASKVRPFVDRTIDNRSMSCGQADATGKVVGVLAGKAKAAGTIRFHAVQWACAGYDDRVDDPLPRAGDEMVLAWDGAGPGADDFWISRRADYLTDQKQCGPAPRAPGRR